MTRCIDAAVQSILLFGGQTGAFPNTTLPADTWGWGSTSWQQSSSSPSTGTTSPGVAYDEKTSALYLFSLTGAVFAAHRWNGTALTVAAAATPPCVPESWQFVALGSNPGGVLFYVRTWGLRGATDPRTWRGDGAAWTRVTGMQPSIRLNAAMAYDRDWNRVVFCGGQVATGTPDLADTWEFDGTAWARR